MMGEYIDFHSEGGGPVRAYLSVPENDVKGPGVLVCHAWWGLTPFFVRFADKLAREGFVALAPDLYNGRSAFMVRDAQALVDKLNPEVGIHKVMTSLDELLTHPRVAGERAGAVGFSMGASYASWLSVLRPEVAAVVMFYGGSEQSEDFARYTHASLLGHFAPDDEWEPEAGVHDLDRRMRQAGKEGTFHFYPSTGHWFFEEDRPDVYNRQASALAWERTLVFLRNKLGTTRADVG